MPLSEGEEALASSLRPQKTGDQRQQIAHVGTSSPHTGVLVSRRAPKDIDEQCRLASFDHVRTPRQRYAHIGGDVGQHTPKQAVGNFIKASHPEELVWLEQGDTKKSLVDKMQGKPTGSGEGWQQQRVTPHRKTGDKACDGPVFRSIFPVNGPEDSGPELGHRSKGNETDTDQRVSLTRATEIYVA